MSRACFAVGHIPPKRKYRTRPCPEGCTDGQVVRIVGEDRSGRGGIAPIERYEDCAYCEGRGEVPV